MRTAPPLDDLCVVGERRPVAGRQLEPLWVIARHEALVVGVGEPSTLAPDGLGDERARGFLGEDHPCRVELNELHVHDRAPGAQGEAEPLTEVLVAAGRAATPQPSVAAGGEYDGLGEEHGPRPGVDVERKSPEARPVGAQEMRDVGVLDHVRNADRRRPAVQRAQDRPTGVVAGEAGAPESVGTDETLIEATVVRPSELAPPLGQLQDGGRRLPRHDLGNPRVGEEVALSNGVDVVLLPAVLRVAGAQGPVDATRCEHGVGVDPRPLAHHHHVDTGLVCGDGGPRAGRASPDDEDTGDDGPGAIHDVFLARRLVGCSEPKHANGVRSRAASRARSVPGRRPSGSDAP